MQPETAGHLLHRDAGFPGTILVVTGTELS